MAVMRAMLAHGPLVAAPLEHRGRSAHLRNASWELAAVIDVNDASRCRLRGHDLGDRAVIGNVGR